MFGRTLHEILVKKDFILAARGLNMPVTRRTLQVVQLDRDLVFAQIFRGRDYLRKASVIEQVLHNKQIHLS